jgi:hypothetical protein
MYCNHQVHRDFLITLYFAHKSEILQLLLRVLDVHAEGMDMKDLLDRTVSRKM